MKTAERVDPVLEEALKRYVLLEEVGSGGYATVHSAVDMQTGNPVAVKLYHKKEERPEDKETTIAELVAYLSLPTDIFKHPGLVEILDKCVTKDGALVVMPLIQGPDLEHMIRDGDRGNLTWQQIRNIFTRVSLALDHLHGYGLMHGDVKSKNIVGAQLADYDTMRVYPHVAESLATTEYYMAPEEFAEGLQSSQTDIYHLTAVLFETLVGQTPLELARPNWDDRELIKFALENLNVTLPAYVPVKARTVWNTIFERGMHKDMSKRPTAGELAWSVNQVIVEEANAGTPIYVPAKFAA